MAWLALHWAILPHVGQWRPQIEMHASRALGMTVRIGDIRVTSGGWVPALELDDVVLHDTEQREALRLPRLTAAVSARSLLAFELRFEQLLVDGAELEVRRDAEGRLHVGGLDLSRPDTDHGAAADWFFAQHEFVVRNGRLRWIDESRSAPPLTLSSVDLVIRNGLRRHEMRFDATPPPGWGARFSLRGRFAQPLLARRGDWQRWTGGLHADLPHADVSELRRHLDLPFDLQQGQGALRLWADVARSELRTVTADLALRDVSLRLSTTLAPLAFDELQGRLVAERQAQGYRLAARDLSVLMADGSVWPRSDLELTVRGLPGEGAAGGELRADRLDLGLLARLASRVPLGDAVQRLLKELAPEGEVQGLTARWEGALDAPERYQVKARLQGLNIAAGPVPAPSADSPHPAGRPGWRKAAIDLDASEVGGSARLVLDGGALVFPGVFERPEIAFDRFGAQLDWRIGPGRTGARPIELDVREAAFSNADAQGQLHARWVTGAGEGHGRGARFPGVLDLTGSLSRGRATAVARYLPLGIPDAARDYVAAAVQSGSVSKASFHVKGDLWDFPAHNAREGEFRVTGQVDDVTLAYVPGEAGGAPAWPAMNGVGGELVFDRTTMSIRNARGRIDGVNLSQVNGDIADLVEQRRLLIEGQGRGPLADMLHFVNVSPVGSWTQGALAQASVNGVAELRLALDLPLSDLAQGTVKGSVLLAGNDVRLRADTPLLGGSRARVDFTREGFAVRGGAARLLGGEATFEGGSQPDGSLRFQGQGVASADGLRRAGELASMAPFAQYLSGQAPYRLAFGFVDGHSEFTLTSPLTGLGLNLPAPLGKSVEAPLPLRIESRLMPEASRRLDKLRFELGDVVQASFTRDLSRETPRVLHGGIGVRDAMPQPANGVHANVNLAQLDTDAWQAIADRLVPASGSAGGSAVGAGADYLPNRVSLRAQEVSTGSRRLTNVVAGASQQTDESGRSRWQLNLDADQLAGYVEWRPARESNPGRVYARLARLSLPPGDVESVQSLLEQAPSAVPALDVVVDDFELRGKKLGRLEIDAVNRGVGDGVAGNAREWRLNRLSLATPEALLSATGRWSVGSGRRMLMDFKLDLADSGAYLERLGTPRALRGGKGRLIGQVSWAGSPLSPHMPSLDGQVKLNIQAGQFLKAGPGVGRLLGVLSLQSLPRRLLLDFRDVFQEGFAFDHVTGDVAIKDGVAHTNNLRMRGLQAVVLMEGQADLARETQDLRVIVVPEIDAGTAALAYAAINPAVGLGTFVAQLFLRRPLMAASTREFHVHGGWAEPQVDRVERKPGEPVPEFESPPAASAAPPPVNP